MGESLEAAIRNNDIETVNHIINSGADIAKIEYDREGDPDDLFNVGKSFLMIAVNNNNLEMLKLLVNNYDNYDDKADFYTTPLKRNRSGYLTLKEYLNEVDYNSNVETALILAVKEEKIDIVEYLLSVGADPNIQDRSQKSALNYAIDKKNEKLIDILLEDSDTNINIGSPPPRDEPFLETYLKITKPSRLMNAEKRLGIARGFYKDRNSTINELPFDTDLPEQFVSDEDISADVIKRWLDEQRGIQSSRRLQFTGRAASPTKSRSRSRSRSRSPKRGGRKRTKKKGKQTKKRGKQTKKRGGRKRTIKRNKKKK